MPLLMVLAALAAGPATRPPCPPVPPDAYVGAGSDPETQCFRSPDGMKQASVRRGQVRLWRDHRLFPTGRMEGGRIIWRPDSLGYVVQDNEGSGTWSAFGYVDATAPKPFRSRALARAAEQRFQARFGCHGDSVYVITVFDSWLPDGRVRLVAQQHYHGRGCRTRGGIVGVIGDPATGRIDEMLSEQQVRARWCTRQERLEPGYCYDEKLVASLKAQKK